MRRLLAAVLLLSVSLSACTHPDPSPAPAAATTAPATLPVSIEGPDSADVQVSNVGQEPSPAGGLTYASDTYQLTPSGPRKKTRVHLALKAPLPAGYGAVVATRENTNDPWTYLPARLSGDRSSVTFATTHFSLFAAIGLDLPALAQTFKTDFLDGLSSGALQNDIPKPKCDREDDARQDGYKIASTTTTDTVYWCLGIEHGGRVLKVTDHRRYPLLMSHPNMATLDNEIDRLELSSLSHFGSGKQTVVGPGNTVTYNADLDPSGSEGVYTEMDGAGQSLYALQTGLETLVDILTKFGGSEISRLSTAKKRQRELKTLDAIVSTRKCASALGKSGGTLLSSCFTADQLITGLGTATLLIAPIFIAGSLLSFGRAEVNALVDTATGHDKYRIVISRAQAPVAHIYYGLCGVGDRQGPKPVEIVTGCEGSGVIEHVTWSRYDSGGAVGRGVENATDCVPDCAGGKRYFAPVQVRLSRPVSVAECGAGGTLWWSRMVLVYTGKLPRQIRPNPLVTVDGHPAAKARDITPGC